MLAWISRRLSGALADVVTLSPALHEQLGAPIAALHDVTGQLSVSDSDRSPDRSELLALDHAGFPWRKVAKIARLLLRAEHDSEFLAFSLLEPDAEVESRLFHVSALGFVVAALRANRCQVTWKSPLGGSVAGPPIAIGTPEGRQWDLWFDSGRPRAHYSASRSTYSSAVASIAGSGQTIRPDLLLIDYPNRALVIECKWSPEPSYVGRGGFHQASSYALDALNGLAEEVWSFVVGPHEVVRAPSVAVEQRDAMGVVLGAVSAQSLHLLIDGFLADDPGFVSAAAAVN